MQQLDVIRKLDEAFTNRSIYHHAGLRGLTHFRDTAQSTTLVLDLSASREILLSSAFHAFNYFDAGYQRAMESGNSLENIRVFFDSSPVFKEGEAHLEIRKAFQKRLNQQIEPLEVMAPTIQAAIKKRAHRIHSALDFSNAIVMHCMVAILHNMGCRSIRPAIHALRSRSNVFYYHYHLQRHRKANSVLAMMQKSLDSLPGTQPDENIRFICQSLLLMGFEPLVATICAQVCKISDTPRNSTLQGICPVSFVSRTCMEPISLGAHQFDAGDICYVSLMPARDESVSDALAFGAGLHVCMGKKLAELIIRLARHIATEEFRDGFSDEPKISPDGAFLSFTNK